MAVSSYTLEEVMVAAMQMTERGYEITVGTSALNMTIQKIWDSYGWRDSRGYLPSFHLIPSKEDYMAPQIALPSDFWKIDRAYFWDLKSDTTHPTRELTIMGGIPKETEDAYPTVIGYNSTYNSLRVHPCPPSNTPVPMWLVDGEYKRRWSYDLDGVTYYKVRPQDLQIVALPWDDQYFENVVTVLKWKLADLSGKREAGTVAVQNGKPVFTGMRAAAEEAIDAMIFKEGVSRGPDQVHPRTPLVWQ